MTFNRQPTPESIAHFRSVLKICENLIHGMERLDTSKDELRTAVQIAYFELNALECDIEIEYPRRVLILTSTWSLPEKSGRRADERLVQGMPTLIVEQGACTWKFPLMYNQVSAMQKSLVNVLHAEVPSYPYSADNASAYDLANIVAMKVADLMTDEKLAVRGRKRKPK